jgi:hypothetical protein
MSQAADLIVHERNGRIALVVEVNGRTETSRAWATQLRRNILAHGVIPNSRFFLLALPDRLYLWKATENLPELVEPTYEIDATPFFQPYYEKAGLTPDSLSSQSFELIVTAWLHELIHWGISPNIPGTEREALKESGLLEALQGGTITVEMPA